MTLLVKAFNYLYDFPSSWVRSFSQVDTKSLRSLAFILFSAEGMEQDHPYEWLEL